MVPACAEMDFPRHERAMVEENRINKMASLPASFLRNMACSPTSLLEATIRSSKTVLADLPTDPPVVMAKGRTVAPTVWYLAILIRSILLVSRMITLAWASSRNLRISAVY